MKDVDEDRAEQSKIGWTRVRTVAGIIGTILWLALGVWWTFHAPTGGWSVPKMDPNAWGDWAAGLFAPLAFYGWCWAIFSKGRN